MIGVFFVILCLGFPLLLIWAEPKLKIIKVISPIIICYAIGLVLGNLPGVQVPGIVTDISEITVPLAIPLLLISTNFMSWIRGAKGAIISFGLCIVSVTLCACLGAFVFEEQLQEAWKLAAMTMGVYTGGTPNMSAIGLSLDVPNETFILMNASDLVLGAIYLLFLMTLAKPLLGRILTNHQEGDTNGETGDKIKFTSLDRNNRIINVLFFLLLALVTLGISIGTSMALTEEMQAIIIILTVTTIGIALSFVKKIESRPGSYELGEYFLLVFCLALGSLADLSEVVSSASSVLSFTAFVMFGSIILHVLLSSIFRLDRDTVIITSVAGIYGPAFVGPIAKVLNNRSVILAGMTTGLIGYAIGNYLGIGVAMLLKNWF